MPAGSRFRAARALRRRSVRPGGPGARAAVLGYELGERVTPHHLIVQYAEANATARVRLDPVAHTYEGREVLLATVTSEANRRRPDEIRRGAARYRWHEVPARVPGWPYLRTEHVGQGRVIAFTGDSTLRAVSQGPLPLFANAVLLGPSM